VTRSDKIVTGRIVTGTARLPKKIIFFDAKLRFAVLVSLRVVGFYQPSLFFFHFLFRFALVNFN